MKKNVFLYILLAAFLLAVPVGAETEGLFTDIRPGDWFFEPMVQAALAGILQGNERGEAMPERSVTRAELAQLVYNCSEDSLVVPAEETVYEAAEDADAEAWYYGAVYWCDQAGLLDRGEDGLFRPLEEALRVQIVTALYRRSGSPAAEDECLTAFSDQEALDGEARQAFAWAVSCGVIRGDGAGRLLPLEKVTRAETAAILLRTLSLDEGFSVPVIPEELLEAYGAETEEEPLADPPDTGEREEPETPPVKDAETEPAPQPDPADIPFGGKSRETVSAELEEVFRRYGAVGAAAAYVSGGEVVDVFSYGWATADSAPVTPDTIFRTASISKLFTALALFEAIENGDMTLYQRIDTALGFNIAIRAAGDKITPWSILTHTSSIKPRDWQNATYSNIKKQLQTESGLRNIRSGYLVNWEYNNYAYCVLGLAVERASGMRLDELLRQGFLDAMDIDAGFWAGDLRHTERIATIYQADGSVGQSRRYQLSRHAPAAGTDGYDFAGDFHISARDLGKVVAALANGGEYAGERVMPSWFLRELELLSPDRVTGQRFYQARALRYATGLYNRQGLYYHTGSAFGEHHLIAYDPVSGDGVVVLTSGADGRTDAFGIYSVCSACAEILLQSGD